VECRRVDVGPRHELRRWLEHPALVRDGLDGGHAGDLLGCVSMARCSFWAQSNDCGPRGATGAGGPRRSMPGCAIPTACSKMLEFAPAPVAPFPHPGPVPGGPRLPRVPPAPLGGAMTVIKQEHLIQSVADALQYISYYHPLDYIEALGHAYDAEQSPAAKDAIAQILTNSRLCAEGHRPICQDTGIVVVFVSVGMDVRWVDATLSVTDMINEGVRRAYLDPDNKLRASILRDPAGKRTNTQDNTPAVVHFDLVPGDTVEVKLAAKGGGSENKSKFAMLNPSDSIVDWVLKTVPTMGAG